MKNRPKTFARRVARELQTEELKAVSGGLRSWIQTGLGGSDGEDNDIGNDTPRY